ncbi:hypothetical protein BASA50_001008 [Batrachochytrium salamandrivorans]|uniref:Uncharacterized protein n=1 Tax=Batrachochytrium salamandrivorans TaxID=1357716 RepID=A0ABQ8ES38_9FUNG|nr:hypothetical protein BASA50_001008 [Batrachochytrium salamandrivorans]
MESVNTLGQVYLRPMGVFNNAMCYSSCEVFSGSIQGHGAGTIFGEDKQTGGGGAIAKELDPSLILGVTQVVRTGLYKGQIIEDAGIKTDTVFRPQWSDLQPDPTTNTQYDRIAASLARTGQENGQSRLHFVCEPFSIEKPINGFSLEVEAAVSTVGSALGNSQIIIVGKTAGKQVLKTKRNVRIIPDDDKYMEISTSGFTFTGLSDSVGLYQSPATAPGNGWNNLKGPWMIGNGVRYVENVRSSIEAFFMLPLAPRSILVSMSLSIPSPDVISSTCLSRAVTVLKTSSSDLRAVMSTKMFNGISGESMVVKETFPSPQRQKSFLLLSSLFLMRSLLNLLVLLSTRSLFLLLEIFCDTSSSTHPPSPTIQQQSPVHGSVHPLSPSTPVVGWTGTVEHESMGTRHDNRALGSTVS